MPPNTSPELKANKALVRRFLRDLDSVGAQQTLDRHAVEDLAVHFPRGFSPEPLRAMPTRQWPARSGPLSRICGTSSRISALRGTGCGCAA